MPPAPGVQIEPVTGRRWPDLVDLFERPGPRGAWPRTSACYCMFWRLEPADYDAAFRRRSLEGVSGGPNKRRMKELVEGGRVPGLLAYREGRAVGWVSAAPRAELIRLAHSSQLRTAEDIDDARTWSLGCFYVYRSEWRSGIAAALLDAAVARAVERGASAVEGYPVKAGSVDPYTGYDTMFAAAGFRLVRQGRGRGRAVWRRELTRERSRPGTATASPRRPR